MWYLCLCENQPSGMVIIICWIGQSTVESQDGSLLAGECDLSKNDSLFLRTCWVFQVIQHHFSCSSGEDKSALAANPSVHFGVPEQVISDTRLQFSCEVFWGICKHLVTSRPHFAWGKCFLQWRQSKISFLNSHTPIPSSWQSNQYLSQWIQPCRWTVGRELRPKHLTLPDPCWPDSLSLQKKEDQHKTSEKQNLEQSASSEYLTPKSFFSKQDWAVQGRARNLQFHFISALARITH